MSKKPKNPFVYPTTAKNHFDDNSCGITLRQLYANSALPEVLKAYLEISTRGLTPELLQQHVVANCFKIADAMLLGEEVEDDI